MALSLRFSILSPFRLSLMLFMGAGVFAPLLTAQITGGRVVERYQIEGLSPFDQFGHALAPLGDVNRDGVPDFLVSAPFADPGGVNNAGSVFVISGKTGDVIHRVDGSAGDLLGMSLAGGEDLDGDRVPDFIAGAEGSSAIQAHSGFTGQLIYRADSGVPLSSFGWSLAIGPDLDRDGVAELAVGAPTASQGIPNLGAAFIVSGATGTILEQIDAPHTADFFGDSVVWLDDLDGDQIPDLAIGDRMASPNRQPLSGAVTLHSGRTGLLFERLDGQLAWDNFGSALAVLGDLDGDQVTDFAVGAQSAGRGGITQAGEVVAFSGATRAPLFTFRGTSYLSRLHEVSGPGDVDGDGTPDILLGAPFTRLSSIREAGLALLHSGANGELLLRFEGQWQGGKLGTAIAPAGDLNFDGRPEFLLGSIDAFPPDNNGLVQVIGFEPFLQLDAETLSVGSADAIRMDIDFPMTEAGLRYGVLASASGTSPTFLRGAMVPLSPDFLFSRTAYSPELAPFSNSRGLLDARGDGTARLHSHPKMASLIGRTLHFAVISIDPFGPSNRYSSVARPVRLTP